MIQLIKAVKWIVKVLGKFVPFTLKWKFHTTLTNEKMSFEP